MQNVYQTMHLRVSPNKLMNLEEIKKQVEKWKKSLILWFLDYLNKSPATMPREFGDKVLDKASYLAYILTKEKMKVMTRRVCREEGLTEAETKILMAVIACESGFDPKIIHENEGGGNADFGLIQANSYWYIEKMKLLTFWESMYDPEKCVRVMIKRYRQGMLKDWVCFSKNLYKNYLNNV